MFTAILKFLGGGIVSQFTAPLLDAYKAKLAATDNAQRIAADEAIKGMEVARDIAVSEAGRKWSATSIGRLLIVLPFGLWWAAIFAVQMLNPWFGLHLVVITVPPDIMDMAKTLVPAIVIGDVGALFVRWKMGAK